MDNGRSVVGKTDARKRTAPSSKEREFQVEKVWERQSLQRERCKMELGVWTYSCEAEISGGLMRACTMGVSAEKAPFPDVCDCVRGGINSMGSPDIAIFAF